MTRSRLYYHEPKDVRDAIRAARTKADEIHKLEKELLEMLADIDRNRFFVRLGFRSLRPFITVWLKFGHTQSQRLVTEVRRLQTTFDSGQEDHVPLVPTIERRLCASEETSTSEESNAVNAQEALKTSEKDADDELEAMLNEMTKYEIDHDERENFRPTRPPTIVSFEAAKRRGLERDA